MDKGKDGLGLLGLTAIVFGSMVGSGIFALPQNVADTAHPGAVLISWLITGAGIFMLVMAFKGLADSRPDLSSGIYQYAQHGFGRFAGYCTAWGYWLCAAFGNVAYAVLVIDAFGGFFPVFLEHGMEAALLGFGLICGMCVLACNGLRVASFLNNAVSILKMASLAIIVILMAIAFKVGLFTSEFWGDTTIEPIGTQVKGTMLVTVWCFLGIEGAVVMGSRAKRSSDIGKAGLIGFSLAWVLYVLVSLLCYGVMSRSAMSALPEPSVAYVLQQAAGDWARVFVLLTVLVSLLGGWIAWTLICAQVPHQAAEAGIFPMRFKRLNKHGMPAYGLVVSSMVMALFLSVVLMAPQAYLTALDIASMMVLPAYLFCCLFLCKLGFRPQGWLKPEHQHKALKFKIIGMCSAVYCLWLMYAAGLQLLMETSIFYVSGLGFYFVMRKRRHERMLTRTEFCVCLALCLLAIVSVAVIGGYWQM